MEYVGGGDLGLHLRNGGLPLAQLREYTHQLVEALCYLHGKAVVHKDLRVSAMQMRCVEFVIRELTGTPSRHFEFFSAAQKIAFNARETCENSSLLK